VQADLSGKVLASQNVRTRFKAGADAYVTDYVSKVREGLSEAANGRHNQLEMTSHIFYSMESQL
jgi:hypothetical protein